MAFTALMGVSAGIVRVKHCGTKAGIALLGPKPNVALSEQAKSDEYQQQWTTLNPSIATIRNILQRVFNIEDVKRMFDARTH